MKTIRNLMNIFKSTRTLKLEKRQLWSDNHIKEYLVLQLQGIDPQYYDFANFYQQALINRDDGFKSNAIFLPEKGYTKMIPNPDFSVRQANDGYKGEWCGNPEYIREEYVINQKSRVVLYKGEKID